MIPESIAPFANHVWQSTAFAAAVWIATLVLRKQSAQVGYALWIAASVKFLVPFSILVGAGSLVESRSVASVAAPVVTPAVRQLAEPFAIQTTNLTATPASPAITTVLSAIWLTGFLISAGCWWSGWRRMRRAVAAARPMSGVG